MACLISLACSISVNLPAPWSAETQTLGQTKRDCVLWEERVMEKSCFVLRSFLSCFKGSLSFPSAFLLRAQQVHSSCREIPLNAGFSLLDRLLSGPVYVKMTISVFLQKHPLNVRIYEKQSTDQHSD